MFMTRTFKPAVGAAILILASAGAGWSGRAAAQGAGIGQGGYIETQSGSRVFYIGEGTTSAGTIKVGCQVGDLFGPAVGSIVIPAGHNIRFTGSAITVTSPHNAGATAAKISWSYAFMNEGGFNVLKRIQLNFAAGFVAGEFFFLDGIQFTSFGVAPGAVSAGTTGTSAAMYLDKDPDGNFDFSGNLFAQDWTDGAVLTVCGVPTMSLATSATYRLNDPNSVACPVITINESSSQPACRGINGIRLQIPAGVNMEWDTTVNAFTPGGLAAGKVDAGNVTYPTNKIALIPVTVTNFAASDTLTITGLKFRNFATFGSAAGLQLIVNGGSLVSATTANTVRVARNPTIAMPTLAFGVNDPNTSNGANNIITVTDATDVAMFNVTDDIEIRIPAGSPVSFVQADTSVTFGGTAVSNNRVIGSTVSFSGPKTCIVSVNQPFAAGEFLTIQGLTFTGFGATTSLDSLEVDGDADTESEDTDGADFAVVQPTISLDVPPSTYNEGEEASAAPTIRVVDSAVAARIRTGDNIRVRIPPDLGMVFNTLVAPTLGVDLGGGVPTGTVSGSSFFDNRTLVVTVTQNFSTGRRLTISGLQFENFTQSTPPTGLQLDVAGGGTNVNTHTSSQLITIGGRPSISSAAQSFTFNDSNLSSTSNATAITVTDAANVAMIKAGNGAGQGIRLVIPSGFNMTWDPNVTAVGSTVPSLVANNVPGTVSYSVDFRTAIVTAANNFGAGNSVILSGLRFANFQQVGTTNLQLEVDGDSAVEATDPNAKSVGRPTISSAAPQSFNQFEESTASVNIVVTDHGTTARIRADDTTGDIRIRIPAGLNMQWDTDISTITRTMGGTGINGNVATGVTYDVTNKIVRIDVTADFSAGRSVQISGLRFRNFGAPPATGNLELICSGSATTTVCNTDDKLITLGGAPSISSPAQSFTFNDTAAQSTSAATAITVTDAAGVAMIKAGNGAGQGIRLVIPSGFNMTWDQTVTAVGSTVPSLVANNVGGTVSYPTPKIALVTVANNFAAGNSVILSGLRFASFQQTGSTNLQLEVDGDTDPEATDPNAKSVGRPTLSSQVNMFYNENEEPTAAAQIRITDDASVARIRSDDATGDIRIRIPDGLSMTWQAVGTVTITPGGGVGGGHVSTTPVYEPGNKVVRLNVGTSFPTGGFIDVSGLQFTNFLESGPSSLELVVNGGATAPSCWTDDKTIRVGGRVTISSASGTSLIVGDDPTTSPAITITDAPGVAMIGETFDIRIVIPAALGVTWQNIGTVGSSNPKVGTSVSYPTARTALLTVTGFFSAGESVTITGLQFATPTAASTASLQVEVDGDTDPEDVDDKSIVVGGPTLSSAVVQTFTKGDAPTAISTITIQESPNGASIKAAHEIRIKIPNTLNVFWDTNDTTPTIGGTAAGRITGIGYENGGKTLRLDVQSNFDVNESVTIAGLAYTGFGLTSSGFLTLEIDGDSAAEATDIRAIRVGAPTISSAASQSFNLGDGLTPISPITVTEDGSFARITSGNGIRIRIPAGLAMEWDTTDLTATLTGAAASRVSSIQYEGANVLRINLSSGFANGEVLMIADLGLQNFLAESSAASLELIVSGTAVCNVDDKTKQIGGQATLSSADALQSFAVKDPSAACSSLIVTDAPGSPKITMASDIRIKIPGSLAMTWDTSVMNIGSTNSNVSTTLLAYEDGGKTAVVDVVNNNFGINETVTISGLRFANFDAAGSGQLTLELDADGTAEAVDTGTKAIGAPTLLSAATQVFLVGQAATGAASFTITDDGSFPRIRTAGGLAVRIPAGLDMVWHNGIPAAGIVMNGAGDVSTSVGYSPDAKTLLLTVTGDFAAGSSVTVTGLQFRNFLSPSLPAALELDVTGAGTVADVDAQTKAIQGAATLASATQGFTTNDPSTLVADFIITDAGGVPTITDAQNIRLKIPAGLNLSWDASVNAITSTNGKVSTSVAGYADADKTVILQVTADFSQNESVTIGGLRFAGFGASSTGQITLEVDGDPAAEAVDAGFKTIGTPSLLSSSPQVLQVGAGPTPAVQFAVTDDPARPRVRQDDATGDIRVKIPASLGMTWNTAVTGPGLSVGAGSGAVNPLVSYSPDGLELRIDVTSDFGPGQTLTVTGLSFVNHLTPALPAALELEVNNQNTNVGVDGQTKAVQGTATIASAAQQFTKGDLSTIAASITVTDAGGVPTITTGQDIRIKIPASLNMTWDTGIAVIGSSNAKVSTALLPYEDAGKTAVLNVVTSDFGAAETVTITGLRFANFAAAGTGQLMLELDLDGTAEAVDAGTKAVGAPTIASDADQAFNTGDAATAISPITVTDDLVTARLRMGADVRIRIPAGFNMSWDAADTAATVSVSAGSGTASSTVSYEGGGTVLVVDILTDFQPGQSLQISGVSFTNFQAPSPLDRLELEVNNAGTTCNEDARTILIGGLPTISSAANQVFTVNDPSTAIQAVTLTDAPGVATFRATRDVRVVIPAGIALEWDTLDTTAVVTPGAGAGTVDTAVSYLGTKTLVLNILTDFSPGQTLSVSGLSFRNFTLPGSGARLELDVDLDAAAEAVDDKTLAIGAPTLSSTMNQVFVVGDAPTAAAALVVTDGLVPRVTQGGDVRIRIPASLNMTWDTSIGNATIGGSAGLKASNAVAYEDGGKTLVVDVTADLAAGETLVVSGVSFANFTATSAPASLELEVNNADTVADLDDKTKAVRGVASISSASNQAFTVGDPPASAAGISIADAGGVPLITASGDLRIILPSSAGLTWNTGLTAPTFGGATGKVAATVTYPDPRTLLIDVTADFAATETLTVSGLGFDNILASTSPVNLGLDLTGDGAPEVMDDKTVAVGAPTLSSAANQGFGAADPPQAMAPLTITEDALTPRIKAATGIRIRIPATFGMVWNTGAAVATLQGTAQARVSPAVAFEDGNRTVVLTVLTDFLPGETLIVSGLEFDPASTSAADNLELETNNLDTVADLDDKTVRIGTRPTIVSALTGDFNGNGSLDRIVVTFSEDVDGASPGVIAAQGFTLAGYTLAFGLKTAANTVTYFIPESGAPDTGAVPVLTYDPATGNLFDVDEGLEPMAYSQPVTDGAPPRVVGFVFADTDGNGFLDVLIVTFSEAMALGQEDVGDWIVLDADGATNLLAGLTSGALAIGGTGQNQLVFTLADNTGTVGMPRYRYQDNASGGRLRDLAGLFLPNSTNNTAPTADAGLDRTLIPSKVVLDASASTDVDAQALSFAWLQTGGPAVVLADAATATPSFSAIASATYTFQVTVGDGLASSTDSVSITILNVPPSAAAGVDQTVLSSATVTLDGTASMDTNGDPITYAWTQVSGPTVALSSATAVAPTFSAAGLNGVLVFRLTVDDGPNIHADDVVIRINAPGNAVPTADAGPDRVTTVGVPVQLDGRRSIDPDADPIAYTWSPAAPLSAATVDRPTFTPATPGIYVFTLVVTDTSLVNSVPSTVRVTVLPAGSTNRPPLPVVAPPGVYEVGQEVVLDASGSTDPDGQVVQFSWTQVAGPVAVLPHPSAASPAFSPIVPGTYVFQLIVGDGALAADPVFVSVPVVPLAGVAPDAVAAIDPADDVDADGRVSIADAPIGLFAAGSTGTGPLVFAWTQTHGPATPLTGATAAAASFTPTLAGTYRFLLVVRDANGLVDTAALTVVVDSAGNAAPTAAAGADGTGTAGSAITLDGLASSDDTSTFGTSLLAFWRQVSGPAVPIADPGAPSTTFTPKSAGTYTFELVLSDGSALSVGDTVSFVVAGGAVAAGGSSSGGGGGCGLTGFEVLLLLALRRRRRHMGCDAAR
jgi:hypothetical protein